MARLVGRRPIETKISALDSGSIPIYNSDLKSWDTINLSEITGSVFPYTGSAIISGSLIVSGSTNIVGTSGTTLLSTNADTLVFTGSLYTSGSIISTGSLEVKGGITGSLLGTASFASNAGNSISSSYATTASSADDFNVRGTLTAQRIIVQTITSSTEYVTGSTIFGSSLNNTHQFTGSVSITGSLEVNGRNYINDSSSFASRITTNSASFASFSGSYVNESSSFASRITTNSASFVSFSGSYVIESSSFANRIAVDSASFTVFSGSYVIESGSFSNRIAANSASFATFSGSYVNESSSFASRITTNSASISSLSSSFLSFSSSYNSASFTGSFTGDGGGLYNIPAGGIVGLNLSRIASGSATASISPDKGFTVNVNSEITGSLIVTNGVTGSLLGTSSYATTAENAPDYLPLAGGTLTGDLYAAGRTFWYQDLILGYGTSFGKITTDGTKYISIMPNYNVESARFWPNGNVTIQNAGTYVDNGFRLDVSGSGRFTNGLTVTGSLNVTNGITGSLLGTSSYAVQALSASYWSGSISHANTASYALNAVSSSYAATASSADDFTVRGTLTAQTIVAQTITSSTEFITGSTKFGSLLSNTHQFTGSVNITGSLNINDENLTGISSSLASRITTDSSSFESRITTNSASFAAFSGSYINESSSFASRIATNSSSFATFSGSYINESSSFASRITTNSASFATFSGSYINESSSFASRITTNSSSFALFSGSYMNESSSFASRITENSSSISLLSSSFISFSGSYNTGSFTGSFTGSLLGTASNAQTASYVLNAVSASFAATSSIATSATRASTVSISGISTNAEYSFPLIATGSSGPSIGLNNDTVSGFSYNPSTNLFKIFNLQSTGSLLGTSSYAVEALTSSYASQALSASYWSGSILNVTSASYAENANLLDGKDSSVFASTGSNSFSGSQIISSGYKLYTDGVENLTGNTLNLFGDVKFNGNVVDVPNDLAVTGSLVANNITGSLLGTASYALNAITASYVLQAISASYASSSLSASYASSSLSASYALQATTASYALQALTSSYAVNALSASYAPTASYALNASDILTYVKNSSGAQINKGTVVRISGAVGDNPLISTASYTDDNNSANTLGITNETIADGGFGYVMTEGKLLGINTDGFTAGQLLFLGATGSIIGTPPVAPLHAVRLGQVLRVQQNNGSMYVRIDNGYELGELHDVRDTSTTSSFGDLLVKSGSIWINSKQLTGSYELTGSLNATSFTGSLLGTSSYAVNANLLDGNDSTIFATTGSNIFKGDQTISGSLVVSGSTTILQNLTVLGTASYNSVTASSLIVTDNWITVTTTSSLGRFGGIKVLDYEGVGETASLAWDTTADRWLEIAPVHDTYSSSLFIMGPKNSGPLGDEVGLTPNFIPRAEDEHHLINSAISDNGSVISLGRNSLITGSLNVSQGITGSLLGTASYASQALTSSYSFYAESVGGIISGSIVTTGSNNFVGNQTISGSLSVTGNLSVLGTASFTYVTASQIALSASFISVNVFEPAERFGGIKVYDSGSLSHLATASLAWDSLKDRWVYQNASGSSYSGGILIAGPRNTGSLGDERTLTSGRIPKSVGGDHIDDSVISEISGSISVSGSLVVTGSLGILQSLYVNQNTSSLASGTQIISTNATSSYTSAFYNYVLSSGANARAGQFIAVWNGSTINYTDVSTTDIGTTSNVALTASLSSGNILLTTVLPSNNWTIKTTVNFL